MCFYLCERPSTARTSLGLRFHTHNSLSLPKELCFNILREFLNRGQDSYPGFDDGGPRIQDTLHFPQCRDNKEIAGDNSWHWIACRTKNSGGDDLLIYFEMLKVNSRFYSSFTLKDSTELSMLCTAYSSDCSGVWQLHLLKTALWMMLCWDPALTRTAPCSSGPTIYLFFCYLCPMPTFIWDWSRVNCA